MRLFRRKRSLDELMLDSDKTLKTMIKLSIDLSFMDYELHRGGIPIKRQWPASTTAVYLHSPRLRYMVREGLQ